MKYEIFKKQGRSFVTINVVVDHDPTLRSDQNCITGAMHNAGFKNMGFITDVTLLKNGSYEIGFLDDFINKTVILFKAVPLGKICHCPINKGD